MHLLTSHMSVNKSTENLIRNIAEEHGFNPLSISSLAGGDINQVFLVNTQKGKKVVKLNHADKFPGMFTAEKAGLEALAAPAVIDIPKVLGTGIVGEHSYLLQEYIASGPRAKDFSEKLGVQLAKLHKVSSKDFGFKMDNYIGSLPQQNNTCESASGFYISQRLEPQFAMAKDRGFDLGNPAVLFKACEELIPLEPPALIHGDLWSGNYIVNSQGNPCLIDPAVAYAPREMDLGMMKLFGGFEPKIFEAYEQKFPLQEGFEERLPLWQLYYLLVHLNIFGAGYKQQVINILYKFS